MTIVYKYTSTPKFSVVLRHWSLCSHYGCNSNKCDGKINVSNAPPQMLTECVVGSLPCANAVGCGNPRVFAKQQQQHLIVLKD
jgi:hypothetical protein